MNRRTVRTQVRVATAHDVSAAAEVLADAFMGYPWTTWTVDAEDHGERLASLHRLYLSAVAVPFGRVDVGTSRGEIISVAVWVPSAGVPEEVWERVGPAAAELAGARAAAAAEAEATLDLHRPAEPHIVLASIGVAPHRQGSGIGTDTLRPGLQRADAEGLPVHLETSSTRNVELYGRMGFFVADVVELPGGGPRTWLMRRAPKPAGS